MTTTAPTPAATTPKTPETTPSNPNGELGKNDFLKLMVAQSAGPEPTGTHGRHGVYRAAGAILRA